MRPIKLNKITQGLGLAMMVSTAIVTPNTLAQETAATNNEEAAIEVIQIRGLRASSVASINTKRFAGSQVDAISATDIGKLPDVTITDSLQRITGVQVERVAGEGGPVQIRGLPQVDTMLNGEVFLNATTIDTPTADFGNLPAQLFSGVEVYKSAEAETTSAGISGAINLKTRRPFSLDEGWTFGGSAELTRGSISKENDPTFHGLVNYNGSKFGVLLTAVTTDVNLATDYNGHNDTSENGGVGWTGTQTETIGGQEISTIAPHGFTAFNKREERERDALQLTVQADLGDGFTLTADYFYTNQERFNNRRGFNHNSRWQGNGAYSIPVGFADSRLDELSGWRAGNSFDLVPYRMQTFTQVNVNEEQAQNMNLQLDFDNGGNLTGQVRTTHARATARMRHGYGEGDILSIDQGTLVTGPGGFIPAAYCDSDDEIVGDSGGCYGSFSDGIEDSDFLINFDASGEHPVFSGFGQMVDGGKGMRSVAEYMADLDSYHIGAFSSEGNTDDEGEITTFSTKWNYRLDNEYITSVDFGIRYSTREVDHDQFTYTSDFGNGCDIAQWKAVDQTYNGASEGDPCYEVEGTGEYIDGVWTPYTLLPPTRLDEHTSVSWQTDFGEVGGIPGLWSIDPENFRDPRAFHERVFGNVARTENGGATYNVGLDEIAMFVQANFEYGDLRGNAGIKAIDTDLFVKQNLVGPNLPHSGLGPDIGDAVTERGYRDYLPSINLAYNVTDEIILRAAYSKRMMPLALSQWGAGKTVGMVFNESCGCMRVENGTLAGNPELDPWRSTNWSLSAEWYFGEASMAFISAYNIEIDSFTQSSTIYLEEPDSDGVVRGEGDPNVTGDVGHPFTANVQGEGGEVSGYEIGTKLAFSDFLGDESVFANFGMDANYTYSDSEQDMEDIFGEKLDFVGVSEDTYNLVGWYEQDEFSVRVAYNSRSPRLITPSSSGLSLYQDDYAQLDVNATYNYNENISFYVNGSNITEEYQQTYIEVPEQQAFQNIYEARWTIGTRVVF